jgi:hypothetical protein
MDISTSVTVAVGDQAREKLGISRATQYELIAAGEIESRLAGPGPRGRRLILVDSWLRYLERQGEREAAGEIGMASPNPRARKREAQPEPGAPHQRPQSRSGSGAPRKRQLPRNRASGWRR